MTMDTQNTSRFEQTLALIEDLSVMEKIRLMEKIAASLKQEIASETKTPLRSLYGLWAGTNVSEEDIEEARREMWGNFPREDIG
jgi:hypothetical protein